MSKVRITLACGAYDRTIPLQDGTVSPPGIDINFLPMRPSSMFRRQARHAEFDVSELSFSTYCMLKARGDSRMIAIPVFPSRKFRHGFVFVNTAAVSGPSDLIGKRIGVHEYQNTASTWIRGILHDDHGVRKEEVSWYLGGLNAPKPEGDRIPMEFGENMDVHRLGDDEYLSEMLEAGEIQAVISPEVPASFRPDSPVRRLFPDFLEVEREYYRRTRIFPIMHTVVIRTDLYESHRWMARTLFEAFEAAKEVGRERLRYTGALYSSLPWLDHHVEEMDRLTEGQDLFAYGLEPNRHVLETFLGYSRDQGLIDRPLVLEELFAPEVL